MKIRIEGSSEDQKDSAVKEKDKGTEQLLDFFQTNRDFFETYAGDSSIKVKKAPEGLNSFAVDLDKGDLYGDPRFFTEKGYSESKAFFAFLHEFEHVRELKDLLAERGGLALWKKHRARVVKAARLKLFDNVWDDVRMNRSVVSRAPSQSEVRGKLYKENLFPESDLINLPKHLQFAYALLRESMLPDEQCNIDPAVRAEINKLKAVKNKNGAGLLDYASRPDIPPSLRIKLQQQILEPVYEKFFKEDAEQEKNKNQKGEQSESDQRDGQDGDSEQPESDPQPKGPKRDEKNPEDYFKEHYKKFFENNPDQALPQDVIDKAVKDYKGKGEQLKNEKEMFEEAYARQEGVSVEDLHNYQNFWRQIENISNPETNELVIEELRKIFRKIISERIKPSLKPKLPSAEGDILIRPAEAVAAVKTGNLEPEVWQTIEVKKSVKKHFGEFDVTVVGDRSGSMDESDDEGNVKMIEQKKAMVLILEALREFSKDLDDARGHLEEDLNVRTEAWSFGSEKELGILKPLSSDLTEKQRVAVYKALDDTSGENTCDFLALEGIENNLDPGDIDRITQGKLKKIVIVLSDGLSSDPDRVQAVLRRLRGKGIVVVGVGITKGGESIRQTYAPDAQVSEKSERLSGVLTDILKEHLQDL